MERQYLLLIIECESRLKRWFHVGMCLLERVGGSFLVFSILHCYYMFFNLQIIFILSMLWKTLLNFLNFKGKLRKFRKINRHKKL
jgi:hypothetical protein